MDTLRKTGVTATLGIVIAGLFSSYAHASITEQNLADRNLASSNPFLELRQLNTESGIYGTEQRTSLYNDGVSPDIAPNARWVVYEATAFGSEDSEIYKKTDDDWTSASQLTSNSLNDHHPSVSPDGKSIVYARFDGGDTEIWVMKSDGSGQTKLTNNGGRDSNPEWSPDGSKIAFESKRSGSTSEDGENINIYMMNPDGSEQVKALDPPYEYLDQTNPTWSPDSKKIAYVETDTTDSLYGEIKMLALDGSSYRVLTNNANTSSSIANLQDQTDPSWSPDGRYVAYVDFSGTGGKGEGEAIYRVATSGDNYNRSLLADQSVYPAWRGVIERPDTTITQSPGQYSTSTASFSFTGTQSGGFDCSLDGAAWTSCSSGKTYSELANGAHTFEVRAKDNYGYNDLTPDTHAWTVDTTAPNTTITDSPADPSDQTTASFEYSGSDSASGVVGYDCRLEGGSWFPCSGAGIAYPVDEGTHTFEVRAIDAAGNKDQSPATYAWLVELTSSTFEGSVLVAPDLEGNPNLSSETSPTEPAATTTTTTTSGSEAPASGGSTSSTQQSASQTHTKPKISGFRAVHKRLKWRRGKRVRKLAFRFKLNKDATVTLRIKRRGSKRAVAIKKVRAETGSNRVSVSLRRAKPGGYIATAVAVDSDASKSGTAKARFRVARR